MPSRSAKFNSERDNSTADVLEVLRTHVRPEIRTVSRVLLDRLQGSVIEGDDVAGFSIPFVFRQVAKSRVSAAERRSVYTEVATLLMEPRGRTFDAKRLTVGIYYAIFAEDFRRAFFWASILVHNVATSTLNDEQVEWLLSRLSLLAMIPQRDDLPTRTTHIAFVMGLGVLCSSAAVP